MEDQHTCAVEIPGLEGHAFFAVYDGHAGHDTAEFAAEQLHKDIATCLAAKQTAAASEGTPPWSDELVVAAIKEVRN